MFLFQDLQEKGYVLATPSEELYWITMASLVYSASCPLEMGSRETHQDACPNTVKER
jgi:hypothetical protein